MNCARCASRPVCVSSRVQMSIGYERNAPGAHVGRRKCRKQRARRRVALPTTGDELRDTMHTTIPPPRSATPSAHQLQRETLARATTAALLSALASAQYAALDDQLVNRIAQLRADCHWSCLQAIEAEATR